MLEVIFPSTIDRQSHHTELMPFDQTCTSELATELYRTWPAVGF